MTRQVPTPGWYPDPGGRAPFRYWDGAAWTRYLADHQRSWTDAELYDTPVADASGPAAAPAAAATTATRAPERPTRPEPLSPAAREERRTRRELAHVEYLLRFLHQAHHDRLVIGRQFVALRQRAEAREDELRVKLGLGALHLVTTPAPAPAPAVPSRIEPEPVVIEPEPVVVEPAPIVVEPEPVVIEPAPIVVEPEPVVIEPEPVVVEPQPVVEPEPEPEPAPVVVGPSPVPLGPPAPKRPSRLAVLRERVAADLAIHWLAYLGVVLLFAGVFGFVAFAFNEVRIGLRPVAEVLIPLGLFAAARFLRSQRAPLAGRAVEVLGGLLLPIVAVAAFNDGSGIPPDVDGLGRALAPAALVLVIAGVYAWITHRNATSPLRFLVAPTAWFAVGIAASATRNPVPTGSHVASAGGWQVAIMTVAILLTAVVARRRPASPLAAATLAVTLPGLGVALGLAVVAGLSESWATGPGAVIALASLLAVEQLRTRLGDRVTAFSEVALLALGVVALAPDVAPAWQGVAAVVGFLLLIEWTARREVTGAPLGLALFATLLGLLVALMAPWPTVVAYAVATAWMLGRRVRPLPLPVAGPALDLPLAVLPIGIVAGLFGALPDAIAMLVTAALVLAVALGVRLAHAADDVLARWWVPLATGAALAGTAALAPTTDLPPLAIAAGLATGALVLMPAPGAVRVWAVAAGTAWTGALALAAADASPTLGLEILAGAGLLAVLAATVRRDAVLGHVGLVGHTAGFAAIVATASIGHWAGTPGLVALGAWTVAWIATGAAVELDRASVVTTAAELFGASVTTVEPLAAALALLSLPVLAVDAVDVAGVTAFHDPAWPVAAAGIALIEAVAALAVRRLRVAGRLLPGFACGTALAALVATFTTAEPAPRTIAATVVLAVVLLAGRRLVAMPPVAWLVSFVAVQGAAELAGVPTDRWFVPVGIWGALLVVGALAVDEVRHGARTPGVTTRTLATAAPAAAGAAGAVTGFLAATVLLGSETAIGWWCVAAAVVTLVVAAELRVGAASGVSAGFAVAAVVLLAPVDVVDDPWVLVVTTGVLAALAVGAHWLEGRRTDAPWFARWDQAPLAVAHGTAVAALAFAVPADTVPSTWIAVGVLSVLVGVAFRGRAWIASGVALALVGTGAAGPAWRTLAVFLAAVGLHAAATRLREAARTGALTAGAVGLALTFASAAEWLDWSDRTLVGATAVTGAVLVGAAAILARVRIGRDWTAPDAALGLLAIIGAGAAIAVDPALGLGTPGYLVGGAACMLALASATVVGPWPAPWGRELAAVALLGAGASFANAARPADAVLVLGLAGLGLAATGATLAADRSEHTRPWVRALLVLTTVGALGAPAAAAAVADTGLLVLALGALTADLVAGTVARRSPTLHAAATVAALATLGAFDRWAGWGTRTEVVALAVLSVGAGLTAGALSRWRHVAVAWAGPALATATVAAASATLVVVAYPHRVGAGLPGALTAVALLALAVTATWLADAWSHTWPRDVAAFLVVAAAGVAGIAVQATAVAVTVTGLALGLAATAATLARRRGAWSRAGTEVAVSATVVGVVAAAGTHPFAAWLALAWAVVAVELFAAGVVRRRPVASDLSVLALLASAGSLADWLDLGPRPIVITAAIAGAILVLAGAGLVRRFHAGLRWVGAWMALGALGVAGATLEVLGEPSVGHGAPGFVTAGALAGTAVALGLLATPWHRSSLRSAAVVTGLLAVGVAAAAAEAGPAVVSLGASAVGLLALGAALGIHRRTPESPWLLPVALVVPLADLVALSAAAVAPDPAPLLTAAFTGLAVESMTAAVVGRRPQLSWLTVASTVGTLASATQWFGLDDTATLVTVATAGAALTVGVAIAARRSLAPAWLWPWLATGLAAVAGAAVKVVGTPHGIGHGAPGLAVAGTLLVVAVATGSLARSLGAAAWRLVAAGAVAAALGTAAVAVEATARVTAWSGITVAVVSAGTAVAVWARHRTSPWIAPASWFAAGAATVALGATAVVADHRANWDAVASLVTGVLLGTAVVTWALGTIWPRTRAHLLTPVLAAGAWCSFAAAALGGNPQWYTVPIGVALLAIGEVQRSDRRRRDLPPATPLGVAIEYFGMTMVVAAALFQTVTTSVAYGIIGIALGALLTVWGALTRVRRRAWFGVAASTAATLLLIGVPLVAIAPQARGGAGLWIALAALGFVAILIASLLERGIRGVRRLVARLGELTADWE